MHAVIKSFDAQTDWEAAALKLPAIVSEWLGIRGLDSAVPLAVLSAALGLCWTLPAAIIPIEALRHLGDAQGVSVLFFAASVVGVAAALCIPLVVHHAGRRQVVVLGVIITVLSSAALMVESPLPLIVGTALRVLGFLCLDVVFEVLIMERIPRRNLARFEAVRMFSMGFGLIIGPWFGVWLSNRVGFWAPFGLLIGVIIVVGLYVLRSRLASSLVGAATVEHAPNPLLFVRRFYSQPRLRLAWLLSFARSAWWTMFFIYGPIYCVQAGLGDESAGAILSVGSAAILLAPLFGKIGSRIGVRKLLAIGYCTTGLATVLVAFVASSPWAGVACLLAGAVFAAVIDAVGNALFLRAVRARERAEMTAVFTTYREVAQLGPPGLFAVLLSVFPLPAVFAVSGASMVAMTFFTRFIPKRFR